MFVLLTASCTHASLPSDLWNIWNCCVLINDKSSENAEMPKCRNAKTPKHHNLIRRNEKYFKFEDSIAYQTQTLHVFASKLYELKHFAIQQKFIDNNTVTGVTTRFFNYYFFPNRNPECLKWINFLLDLPINWIQWK